MLQDHRSTSRGRSPGRREGSCDVSTASPFRVVVRCRGMQAPEVGQARMRYPARVDSNYRCAFTRGRNEIGMIDPDTTARLLPKNNGGTAEHPFYCLDRRYTFDAVFDEGNESREVFEEAVLPLVEWVTSGYNATCFAYGATGSGKTFTMTGDSRRLGVIQHALSALFNLGDDRASPRHGRQSRSPSTRSASPSAAPCDVVVTVSYVEIYNERIYDLLGSGKQTDLELTEDARGVAIKGVSEVSVASVAQLNQLLDVGMRRRTKAATGSNAVSSRSHAVLQLVYQRIERDVTGAPIVVQGSLSLIDLAGSERESAVATAASRSSSVSSFGSAVSSRSMKTAGSLRRREGSNINKSLLALGNCITMLGQHAAVVATQKARDLLSRGPSSAVPSSPHIPYRDSKLTRLLKDSLGGNTRTVMIATITPSCLAYEDTLSTLKYATRAKAITRHVRKNVLTGMAADAAVRKLEELRLQQARMQELCHRQDISATLSTAPPSEVSEEEGPSEVSDAESESATNIPPPTQLVYNSVSQRATVIQPNVSAAPPRPAAVLDSFLLDGTQCNEDSERRQRAERHQLYHSIKRQLQELEGSRAVVHALVGAPEERTYTSQPQSLNVSLNSTVASMMRADQKQHLPTSFPLQRAPRDFFSLLADEPEVVPTTLARLPSPTTVQPAARQLPIRATKLLTKDASTEEVPPKRREVLGRVKEMKINGGVQSAAALHNLTKLHEGGCYRYPPTMPTSRRSDPYQDQENLHNTTTTAPKRSSALLDAFLCDDHRPQKEGRGVAKQYSFRQ